MATYGVIAGNYVEVFDTSGVTWPAVGRGSFPGGRRVLFRSRGGRDIGAWCRHRTDLSTDEFIRSEVTGSNDVDPRVLLQHQEIVVTSDKALHLTSNRGCQNLIIIDIAAHTRGKGDRLDELAL